MGPRPSTISRGDLILSKPFEEFILNCFQEQFSQNKQALAGCYISPDREDLDAMICVMQARKMGFTAAEIKDALDNAGIGNTAAQRKARLTQLLGDLSDPACEEQANAIRDLILADSDHTHTSTHNGNP